MGGCGLDMWVQQMTIFEPIGIQNDPLFMEISKIQPSESKVFQANDDFLRIEYKALNNGYVYEFETSEQHGLAYTLEELYRKLNAIKL
jgi:hypothetical protein